MRFIYLPHSRRTCRANQRRQYYKLLRRHQRITIDSCAIAISCVPMYSGACCHRKWAHVANFRGCTEACVHTRVVDQQSRRNQTMQLPQCKDGIRNECNFIF